jgi:hypothetical protein
VGFAEMVRFCGVVSDPDGETESHVWVPLIPDALTEMRSVLEEVTERGFWTRLVVPAVPASETDVGERVRRLDPS